MIFGSLGTTKLPLNRALLFRSHILPQLPAISTYWSCVSENVISSHKFNLFAKGLKYKWDGHMVSNLIFTYIERDMLEKKYPDRTYSFEI